MSGSHPGDSGPAFPAVLSGAPSWLLPPPPHTTAPALPCQTPHTLLLLWLASTTSQWVSPQSLMELLLLRPGEASPLEGSDVASQEHPALPTTPPFAMVFALLRPGTTLSRLSSSFPPAPPQEHLKPFKHRGPLGPCPRPSPRPAVTLPHSGAPWGAYSLLPRVHRHCRGHR